MQPLLSTACPSSRRGSPAPQQAAIRPSLLGLLGLASGLLAGGLLLSRHSLLPEDAPAPPASYRPFSSGTRATLQQIQEPVTVRFYAVLDPATTDDSLRQFAQRADLLLARYQKAAGRRLLVTRLNSADAFDDKTAAADGIRAFNLHKGSPCYLGLAVRHQQRQASIPRLLPEWEAALESDLSRLLAQVLTGEPAVPSAATRPQPQPVPPSPATLEALKRLLPNLATVPVEDGRRQLQKAALDEYKAAGREMERPIQEAEQRCQQLQQSGSPAEQEAAFAQLQRLQSERLRRLQDIAARADALLEAFESIKR